MEAETRRTRGNSSAGQSSHADQPPTHFTAHYFPISDSIIRLVTYSGSLVEAIYQPYVCYLHIYARKQKFPYDRLERYANKMIQLIIPDALIAGQLDLVALTSLPSRCSRYSTDQVK